MNLEYRWGRVKLHYYWYEKQYRLLQFMIVLTSVVGLLIVLSDCVCVCE